VVHNPAYVTLIAEWLRVADKKCPYLTSPTCETSTRLISMVRLYPANSMVPLQCCARAEHPSTRLQGRSPQPRRTASPVPLILSYWAMSCPRRYFASSDRRCVEGVIPGPSLEGIPEPKITPPLEGVKRIALVWLRMGAVPHYPGSR
jgi:hypothetical protein